MFTPKRIRRILHIRINLSLSIQISWQGKGMDTLNIKSTTNSLITVPQLPGQTGCFSSSSSPSSLFGVTAVAGPKLTLRNVPSSIPKSQLMIVSQQIIAFWSRFVSVWGCAMQVSRTCVRVTQRGWRMLESSWALEWICCSRGRWNVVCFVVWEGMYVSRYSDKQVR